MRHHTVLVLVGAIILASAVAAEDEPISKRAQSRRIAAGSVPFQGHYTERRTGNAPRDRSPSRRPRPSMPAPPYAVQMEPLVQYSQRDPLYHQKNASNNNLTNAIDDETAHTSRVDHQAEPSNNIADVVSPYEVQPQQRYDNPYPAAAHSHYYKEPEPIIEIIIKESNESLPAPPTPPPVQHHAPKKEPVQVFYIKYKKNPNSYGKDGEDDIIYEPPVPALTPPSTEIESDPISSITESPITHPPPPPPPSTTLRTIIHPDSEVYHGSGLKVTFGEPENQYSDHAVEEQSAPEPSISLPTSQVIAQNRDSSNNHFKRQQQYTPLQPETYQTPPPIPSAQSASFQQPQQSQSKGQFPRQSPIQAPAFRPQHTNSFFPPQRSQNGQQPTTHQPPHNPQFSQRHPFQQSAQQIQLQHQQQKPQNQQFLNSQVPTQLPHQRTTFRSHANGANVPQQQQYQQQTSQQHSNRPFFRNNGNNNGVKQQFQQQSNNYQPVAQGTRQQPQFSQSQLTPPTNAPHSQFRSQPIHVQASPSGPFQQHHSAPQQVPQDPSLQQSQYSQLQSQRQGITQAHFPQQQFHRGNPDDAYKSQLRQQQQQQQQLLQQQQLHHQQQQPHSHVPQTSTNIQQSSNLQQPTSVNFPGPIHPKPKSPLQIAFEQQQQQRLQQQQLQQQKQHQPLQENILPNQEYSHQTQQQSQVNRPVQTFDHHPQHLQYNNQQHNQQKFQLGHHQTQVQSSSQEQSNQQNFNKHNNDAIVKAIPKLEQHQSTYQQPQVFFNQNQQQYSNEQIIKYQNHKPQSSQPIQHHSNKFPQESVRSTQLPFLSSTIKNTTPHPQKVYSPIISSSVIPKSTPKYSNAYSNLPSSTTPQIPVENEAEDLERKKKLEKERAEKEKKRYEQNLAALPQEVPDDIREQLLSSGILGNADIQILDYDKVGDIPIENLPPEALENLYGAGSAPIPAVASPQNSTKAPVEMKVVRYDPSTQEGQAVADAYVKEDATQVDPVVLNDSRYNRYLPLKVSGTNFPLPDASLLQGRIINSVVVLAPVDYDFVHTPQPDPEGDRSGRSTPVQVQGVRFIAGDILKDLVKDPSSENYNTWLEKEKAMPTDRQSVVLLVTSSRQAGNGKDKEIFMYDVNTKKISKLKGELSSAFVDVAESNAQSQDLEGLSSSSSEDEIEPAASETHKLKVIAPVYRPENKKLEGFANRDIDLAMAASEPELQRVEKDSIVTYHEQPSIMSGYSKMKEYLPSH